MAWALEKWDVPCEEAQGSIDEEKQALARALEAVGGHLQKLSAEGAGVVAEIAAAHLALLQDPALIVTATDLIDNRLSASHAWHESINQSVESLLSVNDKRMRERVDDLKDMNLRVQRALTGQDPGQGPELPESSILIAENLLPSQLLELDPVRVAGICTAAGGTTSHVAILAISLEIPMLVAAGDEVLAIANGDRLILDAEFGELTVRPDDNEAALFEQRLKEENSRRQTEQAAAHESCHTSDGVHIHFNANLASPEEAKAAVQAGAEGCGLLRTEFVFMSRARAPGVEQQLEIYQQISDALQDRPMVVRTLDAGGDKPISYIEQPDEENPALGVRGIRLSLDNRAMLETQLEALLRLRRSTPLQVMIPLVDFFSIGTNDLTQYTLSMDRGEPRLASRLDTLHPAVLELIGKTATAANDAGIEVAVCGGAAGDMMIAPILLGLGIRELSMPQSLIARQKARLRELSVGDCISLAQNALAMNSAREVRAMMRNFYGN
jgi:phosphocarrier protein FPr/phosphocarrier protein